MYKSYFVFIFLIVLSYHASGQTGPTGSAVVMPEIATLCEFVGITPGSLRFIRPGQTIDQMIYSVQKETNQIPLLIASVDPVIADPFSVASIDLVCHTYLPAIYTPALPAILPIYPCFDTCTWFIEQVLQFVLSFTGKYYYVGDGLYADNLTTNGLPMNCSEWMTINPQLQRYFGAYKYNYTYANGSTIEINVPCQEHTNITAANITLPGVGEPFVQVGFKYGYQAPSGPITMNQYTIILFVGFALGLFTWILNLKLFFLIPLDFRNYLRYPGYLLFAGSFFSVIGASTFISPMFFGISDIWGNGGQLFTFDYVHGTGATASGILQWYINTNQFITSSNICTANGFVFNWSILGTMMVPLALMMATLVKLHTGFTGSVEKRIEKKTNFSKPEFIWNIIVLTVTFPLIQPIILAATGNIVFAPGSAYCGINPQDLSWLIPAWILPLVALPVTSLIFIILIIIKLNDHYKGKKIDPAFFKLSTRLIIISVSPVVVGLLVSIFAIVIAVTFQDVNKELSNWIECRLGTGNPSSCTVSDTVFILNLISVIFLNLLLMIFPFMGIVAIISKTSILKEKLVWILKKLHIDEPVGNFLSGIGINLRLATTALTGGANTMDLRQDDVHESGSKSNEYDLEEITGNTGNTGDCENQYSPEDQLEGSSSSD